MSSYFSAIQMGVLIFFMLVLLSLIPYMILQYRKRGQVSTWRFIVHFSFLLYIICAYAMTIFPLPNPSQVAKMTGPVQNLHLFAFLRNFLTYTPFQLSEPSTWLVSLRTPFFIQPFFNLLLTLPFGFYLAYLFKKKFSFTLIASFLLTLSFELIQRSALFGLYPRPYRLFDVDDLLINTLGSLLGFAIALLLKRLLPDLDKETTSQRASKVSYTRRLISLIVDFVFYLLLDLGVALILKKDFSLLVFTVVFLVIPLVLGHSIGQLILKIQIESKHRYDILFRQVLLLVNFLPFYLFSFLASRTGYIPSNELGQNLILMFIAGLICLLVLLDVSINFFLKSRALWYERLSRSRLMAK